MPKCGNKYSSQYPSCNQCGTNEKEYLLAKSLIALQKKKEQEKKREQERVMAEERRRREAEAEKEKRKQEESEREERQRERELEHSKKMRKLDEERRIKKTIEFQEAYECMKYLKDRKFWYGFGDFIKSTIVLILMIFWGFPLAIINEEILEWGPGLTITFLFLPLVILILRMNSPFRKKDRTKVGESKGVKQRKYFWKILKHKEILNVTSKLIINRIIIKPNIDWDNLESEVINAYRLIYFNLHYRDHNFRCGECGFSAKFVKLPSECPLCHAPSICFEKIDQNPIVVH